MLDMPGDVYLDIETDERYSPTVIGVLRNGRIRQFVRGMCWPQRLSDLVRKGETVWTYNGDHFDLPNLAKIGFELRKDRDTVDLLPVCRRFGFHGGQKALEVRFGWRRATSGLSGADAVHLWHAHANGDSQALDSLLAYNADDLRGIRVLREALVRRKLL